MQHDLIILSRESYQWIHVLIIIERKHAYTTQKMLWHSVNVAKLESITSRSLSDNKKNTNLNFCSEMVKGMDTRLQLLKQSQKKLWKIHRKLHIQELENNMKCMECSTTKRHKMVMLIVS